MLNPKTCPEANIRHKAYLMALTCLHTNRMMAVGEGEGSKEVDMGGEMCSIMLQTDN